MRKSTALVAPFFALAVTLAVAAAAPEFPPLTGRVVDAANVLSAGTEAELTRQLEAHERATGQQIVVATVKDLGGLDIQDYGYQLGRHWAIGGKEHDTGVVLVIAPTLRKVRIDVGYGLEGDLTDAVSSNIIQTRILPEFRKGDLDAGVRAGVNAIIAALGGHGEAVQQSDRVAKSAKKVFPVAIFWLIVLIIVVSGGFGGRRGGGGGLARAIVWGSVLNGMSGGRGRGSGGFGGGGGGFRGGGGSFGGGGASGSW